jgi:xanthine dehydrogenase accessory factor
MAALYDELARALREKRPVALATMTVGPRPGAKLLVGLDGAARGDLGDPDLNRVVARDARAELESGITGERHYGPQRQARQDEITIFVESFAPPPRMLIFGAVDFTAALVRVAKVLGYTVTVCDARRVFATRARFPDADEVLNEWPEELLGRVGASLGPRDAVCVLTHDPKFDVPAIVAALATRVGYIGVMGSRKTHERRLLRLREENVTDAQLERVMAPIGLDIGARTPEETAISIVSEIIALRAGRRAPSLRAGSGPIHG